MSTGRTQEMCSTRFSQRLTFGGWTGKKVENARLNSTFQDEEGDETIQPRVGSSIANRSPPTIWGQIWFCGSGFVWELTSFGIVGDLRTWSFPAARWSWMGGLVTQHQHFLHQMPPNWVSKWWFLGLTVWSSLWWLGSFMALTAASFSQQNVLFTQQAGYWSLTTSQPTSEVRMPWFRWRFVWSLP